MRRIFVWILGALEAAIAAALVILASQLPTRQDMSDNFARVGKVTNGTETQVRLMKEQVADLREQDLAKKADELRRHTRTAAETASRQQIDFRTVDAIARSLADVSKGLHAWADTVDAERMKKVSEGLGETAAFLETGVADPSEKSAAELDRAVAGLDKDATQLATLLRQSPPDLKATRAIHDGLGSFDTGLDKLGDLVKAERMEQIRDGLVGLESSLSSTADQVEKVSGMNYPVITLNGLKPNVEMQPFWPEGKKVAEGLKKATKGVQAANKEMEAMEKSLPDLRKALGQTRESLAKALKQQEETEKLLKTVPEQTAALAEALPKIAKSLATILRETKKLRELAVGLKAVRKSLDDTLKVWPDVAAGLKKSATVLDHARGQLDEAAANRVEYEKAMESSTRVARSLADLLPAFTDQLDSRLAQQEASLEQMETGLAEVNRSLPAVESKSVELVWTVKLLLYLVALLVGLHAGYVLLEPLRGPGAPGPRAAAHTTS
jgi:uncharacterized phage infection (PIP) family protein YhgE